MADTVDKTILVGCVPVAIEKPELTRVEVSVQPWRIINKNKNFKYLNILYTKRFR